MWKNGNPISFQQWKNIHFMNNLPSHTLQYNNIKSSFHPYSQYLYSILNTSKLRLRAQKILFPEQNKSVCGVILLFNLADPEWITIGCYEPLTKQIFCIIRHRQSNKNSTLNTLRQIKLYSKSCILKKGICYIFYWYDKTTKDKLDKVRTKIGSLKMFQYVCIDVSQY